MRSIIFFILLFLSFQELVAQQPVRGTVIHSETGQPLAYAKVRASENNSTYTDISGYFEIKTETEGPGLLVSYPGFFPRLQEFTSSNYHLVRLVPKEKTEGPAAFYAENAANNLIKKAIRNKPQNDPEKALQSFTYRSYNKFFIDEQASDLNVYTDTSRAVMETLLQEGRGFLSEKVSSHVYAGKGSSKEIIEGINTAGFQEPVYEVIAMKLQPLSLYKNEYPIFNTTYAGPLGKDALKNYVYKIVDTITRQSRPAYLVYFKPKRGKIVGGLEGVLYLDTLSYAVRKARMQIKGEVQLDIEHNYEYRPEKNIWFPKDQSLSIKPGTGERQVSLFGGIVGLGTVQQSESILTAILPFGEVEEQLYLSYTTTNFKIALEPEEKPKMPEAAIFVKKDADNKDEDYWTKNRQEPFTARDQLTASRVDSIIEKQNVERILEIQNKLAEGFFPLGFLDVRLGRVFRYNRYEGYRLGFGGRTNEKFSKNYRLNTYAAYGFRDEAFKYGIKAGKLLNARSNSWIDIGYSDDIRELAGFNYLRGINDWTLFVPRLVNITDYYREKSLTAGITHRMNPGLETEWIFSRNQISQLTDYFFLAEGRENRDYVISEATVGILWRPFSRFLEAPHTHMLLRQNFPRFTAQVSHSFDGVAGGDFSFTKLALQAEHRIERLDRSGTRFIVEAKYAFGDLPLTHAFHADPNNPNEQGILERFSFAGNTSFETMFFNEFFSDRQVAVHLRHRLRPFYIASWLEPELVLVSRHVTGDFRNPQAHGNIEFQTLENIYNEAALELNNVLLGFGLNFAYRYGAYHLPTFRENFSLKFTFRLNI